MRQELYLLLRRNPDSPSGCTLGKLYETDGVSCKFLCDTLEPDSFGSHPCIPAGEYRVCITYSPRFHRDLPLVMDVPNRSGIRIHPGNYPKDTSGCILVGLNSNCSASVGFSRETFDRLFDLLRTSLDITLKIEELPF